MPQEKPQEYYEELRRKALEWVQTPEGQRAVRDALTQASRKSEALRRVTRVDPALLREPYTI